MKKFISLFLPLLLLLNVTTAFAAAGTEVYSDTVHSIQGETVTVPVKIRNNTGVMGFRLTFTYPDELESPEVLRGALLNDGLLNDSIVETTKGCFDVVWSNTQNVTDDGTILLLNFKVASDAQNGNYKIDVSYNQADTFNEAIQDVVFCCKSVEIIIGKNAIETTKAETSHTVVQKPIEETDSLILKKIFEKALEVIGTKNFDTLSDEDLKKFKELVSKELLVYGASGDELEEKSKEEIEEIYNEAAKDAFVDLAVNTANGDVIDNAIKENLASVGAESIEVIPPEKQQEFVDRVINTLTENGAEIEKLPDSLTDEQAVDVIESLSSKNEEGTSIAIDDLIPKDKPKSYVPYIAAGIAAVVIIAAVAVFIIKRKNYSNIEKDG